MKRVLDLVLVLLTTWLWLPLLCVVALLVRIKLGAPVFFRQQRPGKDARLFELIKFRTMTDAWDDRRNLLPDSDRLTPFGCWLRETSLDELPELLNVLRGDMSLVGPRPCIPYDTQYFQPHHFERFLVPAGLTGLWQVTARAR